MTAMQAKYRSLALVIVSENYQAASIAIATTITIKITIVDTR